MANTPIAHVPGSSQPAGTKQPQHVMLIDANGDIVSVGGGTQYTEDAAAAADPVGNASILVRADTPAGVASANGDNVAQRGTDYGAAYVQVVSSTGAFVDSFGGGTQYTEGDTDTTITGTALLWEDAGNTLAPVNTSKPLPVVQTGTLNVGTVTTVTAVTSITNALPAGTNAIGKLSANSGVDIGDTDVTSVVPGTGATNLGKAEDGGHTSGDVGVFALAVRQDSPDTAVAGTTADYSQISVSSTGALRNAPMSEDFAALANGPQVKKYYTNAGAVTDGIVWSPAAGKRWYATDIFINVSAASTVTLEDDLVAGDAAVWKAELAANSGWSHAFNTPLFSGEDAADLLVTSTAGNIYITVTGYEI